MEPPPPDDDLVAYLDGELAGPAADAVAARLAADPAARDRADALRKTFDLLDHLPRAEPAADFTARTVSQLDAGPPPDGPTEVLPKPRQWRPAAARAAVLAAAVGLGYAGRAAVRPATPARPPDPRLSLADLRVAGRLPLYLGVDDVGFVRRLEESGLFPADDGPPPAAPRPGPPADIGALAALFAGHPPARQHQLRRLDRDLNELPADDRDRLTGVIERYAVWLDRLPDPDRRAVLEAPTPGDRLDVVRQARERAWRAALPAGRRDLLAATADPDETVRLAAKWKAEEQARRDEWALARRQWAELTANGTGKPWPFADPALAAAVDAFVRDVLRADLARPLLAALPPGCRLSKDEYLHLRARHEAAVRGGGWLLYGACVRRLADRHPGLPPPADRSPVTDAGDLPAEWFADPKGRKLLAALRRSPAAGRWPDFALDVAAKFGGRPPGPLGPARPGEYGPAVDRFLADRLWPALVADERDELTRLEGDWPGHPSKVVELARRHDLAVPGLTLPGPPSLWAKYYPGPGS